MERGGSSKQQHKFGVKAPRSRRGIVIQEPSETTNVVVDANNLNILEQQPSFKRDSDQYMPIANIVRIMRRVLPPNAKIADDAKETIQECVSEFINFITSHANEKCHGECRKTITPEDVLSAMRLLEFENYAEALTVYLNKLRSQDPNHNPMRQLPLVKRSASLVHEPEVQMPRPAPPTTVGYVVPSTMGYALPSGAHTSTGGSNSGQMPQMGNFTMGSQGGSEGSNNMDFDPLWLFK